jgi:hypothetical protein
MGGRFINGSGALRGEVVNVRLESRLAVIASGAKQSISPRKGRMDCFAEPVIGRRFAPTRWLAMTVSGCSILIMP